MTIKMAKSIWQPKHKVWFKKNDDFTDAVDMEHIDNLSPEQKHELINILDRRGQSESLAHIIPHISKTKRK